MPRKKVRPTWDVFFMRIAKDVSTRASCPRASVGAVVVRNSRILTTGYNGAPAGEPHCTDVGCLVVDNHCQRAIHAEANAIAEAANLGVSLAGATMYFWDSTGRGVPCYNCLNLMKAAGIVKIINNFNDITVRQTI